MAGSGVHEKRAKIYTAERRAKLDAANEKRRATIAAKKAKADAARLAERRIEQVEIEARFPETFAILNPIIKSIERDDDVETVSDFAVVTARRWIAGEEVSDERLEKVVEVVEKFETAKREREAREQIEIDRKANATHVATIAGNGVELRGQILSIQNRVSGYNGDNVAKMLFQDERGFRLWGTVPTALHIEIRERNLVLWSRESEDFFLTNGPVEVAFVANVDASNDDHIFGFFKRPGKGEVFSDAVELDDDDEVVS